MDVGERLFEFRNRCWLTQNGLAEKAGVSQSHLRRVELGWADITVGHLELLCDAMDISLKEIFNCIYRKLVKLSCELQLKKLMNNFKIKIYRI